MNCDKYRKLHKTYSVLPLPQKIWDTQLYNDWVDHFHNCEICSDWNLGKRVEAAGYVVSDFPCVHIAYQVTQKCETHPDPHDCPDILILEWCGGYAIPIRDGGLSASEIKYCPWCGKEL